MPSEAIAHPFDAEGLELSLEDAADMVKNSAQLHNLPELAGWFPDKGAVDELFAFVGKGLSDAGHDPTQEPPAEALRDAMNGKSPPPPIAISRPSAARAWSSP